MNCKHIEKPKTTKAQMDLVWRQAFNHIPSKLNWLDMKLNFILVFTALILGLLGVLIAR